jgi:hypothetical protein
VIDEVFADDYLDVVKAAALLRLPPTLTEGLARIPTEGPLARSSAYARGTWATDFMRWRLASVAGDTET